MGLLAFISLQKEIYANYPIGRGRTAVITTYNYFASSQYYDTTGKLVKYPPGNRFQSKTLMFNLVHGINRNLDFSLNAPILRQEMITGPYMQSNTGLGDINMSLSFHFPDLLYKKYFTIKTGVIIPTYTNNDSTPQLGYSSKAFQLSANYSFSPFKNGFGIVDFGYTRFLDDKEGPNQYTGSLIVGKIFNKYTTVTLNYSHQLSISTDKKFNQNVMVNKNFYGGNLSLSVGRRLTRSISATVQVFHTMYGKNMGIGTGASCFFTISLP